MKTYHVIFHLDEDSEQKASQVFNNIENLLEDLGEEDVEVELLANGGGVMAMRKDNRANGLHIHQLARQGVKFVVCINSINHLGIATDELVPEAEIVPSGVGELVKRQTDGWAYIRP